MIRTILAMALRKIHIKWSVFKPFSSIWTRSLRSGISSEEETQAHKDSLRRYNKAGLDYEYLFGLEKYQLVYKVIRLQRQIDSYTVMKSVTNLDGRDKIRVDHPEPEQVIDHADYNRRRIAFKVAYLGWDYMGYAWSDFNDRSVKGHTNTVERVFLEALLRQQLTPGIGRKVNLDRAGRTDATVSGLSQVICANVRTNLDDGFGVLKRKTYEERELEKERLQAIEDGAIPDQSANHIPGYLKFSVKDKSRDAEEVPYVRLLNEALPPDIRVLAWSPVSYKFSPRGGCIGRTYKYYFPRGDLDVDLMNRAAQKLVGTHDFCNFAKLSSENYDHNFEKELKRFEIEVLPGCDPNLPECDICCATVTASGFLYRQVRLMMSVLVLIGNGSEDSSIIDILLDTDNVKGRPSYSSLGGAPLLFYEADYREEDVHWRYDRDSLKATASIMGELWSHNAMKSEIVRAIYYSSLQNLSETDRMEIRNAVHLNVIQTDQSSVGRKIMNLQRANSAGELREKEVVKAVRRLQRKGRYNDAQKVKAGTSDVYVGWTSEPPKLIKQS